MFINFSNHPSAGWSKEQLAAANKYGDIKDIPFPNVSPSYSEKEIGIVGEDYINKIMELSPEAVMVQGEYTLVYYVVKRLLAKNILCLSATSERRVREIDDGSDIKKKVIEFEFVTFRKYS